MGTIKIVLDDEETWTVEYEDDESVLLVWNRMQLQMGIAYRFIKARRLGVQAQAREKEEMNG